MKDKKSPFSYAAIEMMDESGKTIKKKEILKKPVITGICFIIRLLQHRQ